MDSPGALRVRAVLDVRDLRVEFRNSERAQPVVPVDGVSFTVGEGERVALVGESGSGKSLTALAITGLVRHVGGRIAPTSEVLFQGNDTVRMSDRQLRRLRGAEIGMIFQDPLSSLNPVLSVGSQVLEVIALHLPELDPRQARQRAIELLAKVRLPRPERLVDAYPHELSGGMRQRVMIAIALAGEPSLLIADEPTTALDVTVQAEFLELLDELCAERGTSVVLITHDLGIVAGFADRVVVMYAGRIVESQSTDALYRRPRHPYTAALLRAIPPMGERVPRLLAIPGTPPSPEARPSGCAFHDRCDFAVEACALEVPHLTSGDDQLVDPGSVACLRHADIDASAVTNSPPVKVSFPGPSRTLSVADDGLPLLSVEKLSKSYRVRSRQGGGEVVDALKDVSLQIFVGESIGIVGQSGSGKTTLSRCMLRLTPPTSGSVRLRGEDLMAMGSKRLRAVRRDVQMLFQDPGSSLDSRMRVGDIIREPLRIHKLWGVDGQDDRYIERLLSIVGLPGSARKRYPHQFSGGQRQRIAIARALALRPSLLVLDEPVSSLDVSVRSSIMNLLVDIRRELGITLVFIAHDLSLVRFMCDRVGVMFDGELVELADNDRLYRDPQHAHTRALLEAQPEPNPAAERSRRRARRAARGTDDIDLLRLVAASS